jgi:hypothetical protein
MHGNRGDVQKALLQAARVPGTVREVYQRAQVGAEVGRKACSQLKAQGRLVILEDAEAERLPGPGRPPAMVVAADAVDWQQVGDTWEKLQRAFSDAQVPVGEDTDGEGGTD